MNIRAPVTMDLFPIFIDTSVNLLDILVICVLDYAHVVRCWRRGKCVDSLICLRQCGYRTPLLEILLSKVCSLVHCTASSPYHTVPRAALGLWPHLGPSDSCIQGHFLNLAKESNSVNLLWGQTVVLPREQHGIDAINLSLHFILQEPIPRPCLWISALLSIQSFQLCHRTSSARWMYLIPPAGGSQASWLTAGSMWDWENMSLSPGLLILVHSPLFSSTPLELNAVKTMEMVVDFN